MVWVYLIEKNVLGRDFWQSEMSFRKAEVVFLLGHLHVRSRTNNGSEAPGGSWAGNEDIGS